MNSGNFQSGAHFEQAKIDDPMIGSVLDGRFEIVRLLGTGGMGAVYLSNQIGLGKTVAVKIMHPQLLMDDRTVLRFQQEIKAMSNLTHPNLISIIDAGKTGYGSPYFAMEYLPSRPLNVILAEEVFLPGERVKSIIAQCADALSHAHARNIVHRDLKPANILVIESGNKDHIKIVDLGVSKLIGGDEGEMQKLTATGEVFGSPLYMSPEQILGKPHDGRTDVYQLGCVLFEMVTGVPPYVKPSPIMTMNCHVTEEPPTFNQVMPELPMDDHLRQLEIIAIKCLAKNPADRYQSMSQLLKAVEADPGAFADANRKKTSPQQSSQPSSPKPIKDRFAPASHLVEDSEDSELYEVAEPRRETASRRGKSREAIEKANVQSKSPGGFSKNHLIIAGSIVLFLILVASIIGIYSIVTQSGDQQSSLQNSQQSSGPTNDVSYPALPSDSADLRVLSVYQGETVVDPSAAESVKRGTIDVEVKTDDKPVVLVLNAYMPTTWNIRKATDRVNIKRVIPVGYYSQQVIGVAPSVVQPKVYYMNYGPHGSTNKSPRDKNAFEPFYFLFLDKVDMKTDGEFKKMKSVLEKATKLHLRKFQGTRSTPKFVVD